MRDWLTELLAAARRNQPIACAGCGRAWDRADMLEASLPDRTVGPGPGFPLSFTLFSVGLVGPCCAALADQEQP
jgi:hypothetical protein